MSIGISRGTLDAILADVAMDGGRERCGLLFGGNGRVDAAQPVANVHPNPARFFELDPAALIAAHRHARAGGAAMIGHYHSHPHGAPVPSVEDAACAQQGGLVWIIVAQGVARAWRSTGQPGTRPEARFAPLSITIFDGP